MRRFVVSSLQVEGLHCWPEAKQVFPEVGFLSDPHRHMFHITAVKKVEHNDRDVEIIKMKHDIQEYLESEYHSRYFGCLDFNRMSCEDIAEELVNVFELMSCKVLEDGENGAIIQSTI